MAKVNKVRFFPLDVSYTTLENKPAILLFGRTTDKQQICVVDFDFKPYFLILPGKDSDKGILINELKRFKVEEKDFTAEIISVEEIKKNIQGKPTDCIKVSTNFPKAVPIIKDSLKEWESIEDFYEHDIKYVRRYLIDKKIVPFSIVEVEGEPYQMKARVPVIKAKTISSSAEEAIEDVKILGFDIETYSPEGMVIDPENNPIIMISIYGKDFSRVITWKKFKTNHKYVQFVNSEAELIEKFKNIIEDEKPDILTGYFSDGFDLPYIPKGKKI